MPTLDWIGKAAVVNHHQEVPTRLLHCDSSLSAGAPEAGNLLVEGDNLEALKALLPYYAGKFRFIYIDPPYNTGSERWVYNDNVNSPEIRRWLDKVVGKEGEDLSRHDKWLCMMYPRLRLLYDLLNEDGVLACSINDIELPRLRLLLEAIFHATNFVCTFIWVNEGNIDNQSKIKTNHEYIIAFVKREGCFAEGRRPRPSTSAMTIWDGGRSPIASPARPRTNMMASRGSALSARISLAASTTSARPSPTILHRKSRA